ncbi:MAG: hypothetical protein SF339_23820 [Blastocatellia bacterium]|nr:hypothetical protein [Blastocatellia bacterium]
MDARTHSFAKSYTSTLNVRSFADPTPTNIATESTRSLWTGFGAVTSVRPPRNMQLSARFQF